MVQKMKYMMKEYIVTAPEERLRAHRRHISTSKGKRFLILKRIKSKAN